MNNSAYENHDKNEIKFYDGNKQRDTPTFNVISTEMQPSGELKADIISASALYKGIMSSITDRNHNSAEKRYIFNGSKQNKINKEIMLHERNDSNITLPKLKDSIELSKIEDLEKYQPQSEQKQRRNMPDVYRSKSQLQNENLNVYKIKSRNENTMLSDIKTGEK